MNIGFLLLIVIQLAQLQSVSPKSSEAIDQEFEYPPLVFHSVLTDTSSHGSKVIVEVLNTAQIPIACRVALFNCSSAIHLEVLNFAPPKFYSNPNHPRFVLIPPKRSQKFYVDEYFTVYKPGIESPREICSIGLYNGGSSKAPSATLPIVFAKNKSCICVGSCPCTCTGEAQNPLLKCTSGRLFEDEDDFEKPAFLSPLSKPVTNTFLVFLLALFIIILLLLLLGLLKAILGTYCWPSVGRAGLARYYDHPDILDSCCFGCLCRSCNGYKDQNGQLKRCSAFLLNLFFFFMLPVLASTWLFYKLRSCCNKPRGRRYRSSDAEGEKMGLLSHESGHCKWDQEDFQKLECFDTDTSTHIDSLVTEFGYNGSNPMAPRLGLNNVLMRSGLYGSSSFSEVQTENKEQEQEQERRESPAVSSNYHRRSALAHSNRLSAGLSSTETETVLDLERTYSERMREKRLKSPVARGSIFDD